MTVATPDPRNIVGHVPGQLAVNCTDFSTAFPHGGTALGEVTDAALVIYNPKQTITAEEHGIEPYEVIDGGMSWSLACMLREWNKDAYAQFFLNSGTGATSGNATIEHPDTNVAGYSYSDREAVFAFSPYNLKSHPIVVFYAGMPMLNDTSELAMALGGGSSTMWGVPVVILGRRDGSERMIYCGRVSDAPNP